jgi:DNA-binding NtrC family response regulator
MVILKEIKKIKPKVQVIMVTDKGSVGSYLEAMILGAFEYFNKPVKNKILCRAIEKALVASI